jgi:MFS family permease
VSVLFGRGLWPMIISFVVFGLHRAALDTVQRAFVAELSPTAYRASVLGGYQMVIGLCAFPASFVAGVLWSKVGVTVPLSLSLVLTTIAVTMLFFVREKQR